MVNKIKFSMIKSISLAMLSFAVPMSANALEETSVEDINDYLKNGVPGFEIKQRNLPAVPDGYKYEYEYKKDGDGISFEAYQSYGYSSDWSDQVNTTPKTVKLLDTEIGVDAGISLGCSGIDLVEEAMFKFDATEFMDALKNYARTKMAVEALAQIYATPLISTVMDGIKSMNNFVAEFSQATCDMSTVKGRAAQIADDRKTECINELTAQGLSDKSIEEYCGPSKITQMLKKFQCSMSQRASLGTSLSEILGDQFGYNPIAGGSKTPTGITQGEILSFFIPDVKFSLNGADTHVSLAEARKPLSEVNNQANNTAYNLIVGIYNEFEEAMNTQKIESRKIKQDILVKMDAYKDAMLKYGDPAVYEDPDALEINTEQGIKDIQEDHYKPNSRHAYRTNRTTSKLDEFIIGDARGNTKPTAISASDLQGDKSEDFLKLGKSCWAQVYKTDSEYSWSKVYEDPKAILSISDVSSSNAETFTDKIIDVVASCKAARRISFTRLDTLYGKEKALAVSYIKYITAQAAYETAQLIAETVNSEVTSAIQNSEALLMKNCQNNPGFLDLPEKQTASKEGVSCTSTSAAPEITGQKYSSCADYAEQNKLSEGKIDSLKLTIEDNQRKLSLLKEEAEEAKRNFDLDMEIYTIN